MHRKWKLHIFQIYGFTIYVLLKNMKSTKNPQKSILCTVLHWLYTKLRTYSWTKILCINFLRVYIKTNRQRVNHAWKSYICFCIFLNRRLLMSIERFVKVFHIAWNFEKKKLSLKYHCRKWKKSMDSNLRVFLTCLPLIMALMTVPFWLNLYNLWLMIVFL